jgi:hypothetical protein
MKALPPRLHGILAVCFGLFTLYLFININVEKWAILILLGLAAPPSIATGFMMMVIPVHRLYRPLVAATQYEPAVYQYGIMYQLPLLRWVFRISLFIGGILLREKFHESF